jgi:hypothetical protein
MLESGMSFKNLRYNNVNIIRVQSDIVIARMKKIVFGRYYE